MYSIVILILALFRISYFLYIFFLIIIFCRDTILAVSDRSRELEEVEEVEEVEEKEK